MCNRNDDDPKRPTGTARKLLDDAHKQGALSAASAAALDVMTFELPHFIMERRMMLQIKALAEEG